MIFFSLHANKYGCLINISRISSIAILSFWAIWVILFLAVCGFNVNIEGLSSAQFKYLLVESPNFSKNLTVSFIFLSTVFGEMENNTL